MPTGLSAGREAGGVRPGHRGCIGSRTLSLRRAARARAEDAVCFLGQDAPGRSVAAARGLCGAGVFGACPARPCAPSSAPSRAWLGGCALTTGRWRRLLRGLGAVWTSGGGAGPPGPRWSAAWCLPLASQGCGDREGGCPGVGPLGQLCHAVSVLRFRQPCR